MTAVSILVVVIVLVATAAPATEDLRAMGSTVLVCFGIGLGSNMFHCSHTHRYQ